MSKRAICVSLDFALVERCDEMAELLNVTRSAFVANALIDYITQNDAMARLMGNPDAIQALMKSFAQPGVISAISQSMGTQAEADAAQPFLEFITTYEPPPPAKLKLRIKQKFMKKIPKICKKAS